MEKEMFLEFLCLPSFFKTSRESTESKIEKAAKLIPMIEAEAPNKVGLYDR